MRRRYVKMASNNSALNRLNWQLQYGYNDYNIIYWGNSDQLLLKKKFGNKLLLAVPLGKLLTKILCRTRNVVRHLQ